MAIIFWGRGILITVKLLRVLFLGREFERESVCVKSLQLCPTPCDPMDCSLPDSSVHGILPARILEWVAISVSRIWEYLTFLCNLEQWKCYWKMLPRCLVLHISLKSLCQVEFWKTGDLFFLCWNLNFSWNNIRGYFGKNAQIKMQNVRTQILFYNLYSSIEISQIFIRSRKRNESNIN